MIYLLNLSILVESIIEKDQVLAVVVGFGININQIEFRDELKIFFFYTNKHKNIIYLKQKQF